MQEIFIDKFYFLRYVLLAHSEQFFRSIAILYNVCFPLRELMGYNQTQSVLKDIYNIEMIHILFLIIHCVIFVVYFTHCTLRDRERVCVSVSASLNAQRSLLLLLFFSLLVNNFCLSFFSHSIFCVAKC